MRYFLLVLAAALVALLVFAPFSGCASVTPNRVAVGEAFPAVEGEALDGTVQAFPGGLGGKPAVLLIGYVQDTQFDLDRWLIGLTQLKTPVQVYELPTIAGLFPGMFAGTIADGMRSGIPEEMWAGVVTLYDESADLVIAHLGNERPRCGRVLLLDGEGKIVWMHDRGFSPAELSDLDARVRALEEGR